MRIRWHLITVAQFQELDHINTTESDEIDKVAYSICAVYGKKPDEVNEWSKKKFLKYVARIERLFSTPPPRSWFELPIETDATKINYGQFVEIMYFLQNGMMENLHHIAASLMGGEQDHHTRAQMMLETYVTRILHPVSRFVESWEKLINSYSGLFEIEELKDEEGKRVKGEETHPFIEQYGWIFSGTKLAEHEKIKLEEVWDLPIIQALNGLSYLKSKTKYEQWLERK